MSTFLLKCHSEKNSLKTLLNRFDRRVKSLKHPFQFLEHLASIKMDDKVFYWPSVIDGSTVAEGSSSVPPGEILSMDDKNQDQQLYTVDISYLTQISILQQQYQHQNSDIKEEDIVYPTFIGILYDRRLESMKKIMEVQSKIYKLSTKSGNIQVNPNSSFLETVCDSSSFHTHPFFIIYRLRMIWLQ